MTTLEIVRLVAPEFNSVDDSTVNGLIELSMPLVSKKQFGNMYEQALAYLVCHRMTLGGYADGTSEGESAGDSGGEFNLSSISTAAGRHGISSLSEAGNSISFADTRQTNLTRDAEYSQTPYGVQYLTIRRLVIVPIHCSGETIY